MTKATVKTAYNLRSTSMTATTTLMGPTAADAQVPRVFYAEGVYEIIKYIIAQNALEVGWWGLVEKHGADFLITQIYVPEQTVHGAETDIDSEAMAALAMEILAEDKDPGQLYYWGHSHVHMAVSPSGQDESQVIEYLETGMPHFIRGIYNKNGQAKIDVYDTVRGVCHQCVQHETLNYGLDKATTDSLDVLIKTNVKRYVAPPYQAKHNPYTSVNQPLDFTAKKTIAPDADKRVFLVGEGAREYMHGFLPNEAGFLEDPLDDQDDVTNESEWAHLDVTLRTNQ